MSLTFDLHRNPSPASDARRAEIHANPGFGVHFTDHMVRAVWTREGGWGDGRVEPYGPIPLLPSAAVLHYAQEVFEGLKAYRHADGSVWSFRPEANAERMQRSARRLALPELSTDDFVASLRALLGVDEPWVPPAGTGETSLYLRPFLFASEAFLGVRPADEVTYCLIASPAGAYFAGGLKPVTLWISQHYARAGTGGTGAAKTGGNYASSLAGQLEGIEHGCDQAVFLDSSTQTYIEELGGMNLFFVTRDNRLVTPELTGSILEGVTRGSILELAKGLGLEPGGAPDPHRGVEGRGGERRDPRGLRLRHRGGDHPGRRAAVGGRLGAVDRRRVRWRGDQRHPHRPARHPVRARRGHPRLAHPARLTH